MSTTRNDAKVDRLDTAIDRVTARMTAVPDDDQLTKRIVASLPERSSRFGWLMPQFAAIAAFAIAAVVWTLRDTTTPSLLPSSDVVAAIAVPNPVAAVEPGTALRTLPLERLEPLEPVEPVEPVDGSDFERSLAPIEAMSALVMRDMDLDALPGSPALTLAPIEIADLPMTAESFPPR